jgi:hypothetical protein
MGTRAFFFPFPPLNCGILGHGTRAIRSFQKKIPGATSWSLTILFNTMRKLRLPAVANLFLSLYHIHELLFFALSLRVNSLLLSLIINALNVLW